MIKGFLYTTFGIDLRSKPVVDSYWSQTSMDYSNPIYDASDNEMRVQALPEIIQIQKDRADMRSVYVKKAPVATDQRIA